MRELDRKNAVKSVKSSIFFNAFIEDESSSKVKSAPGLKIESIAIPMVLLPELKREIAAKGYAPFDLESGKQAVVTRELNRGVFK